MPLSEPIEIVEVDARAAPDDVLARFHAIEVACHEELQPGEPVRGLDEVIAFYRHQPTTHTSCHWLADGGSASLYVHGPTAAFLHLLVAPAKRRRGAGSALLGRVLQRARQLDVRALRGSYATAPGAGFAAHVGAVAEDRVVRSVLDLRDADLPEPDIPEGFELVTWLERVPDVHLSAYVEARAAMDDAPGPEGMELPSGSSERVRASEEALLRRGREMRLTVAMDDHGRLGAFTELRVSRGSKLGFTDDTGTVAALRGQGLARAVKLESLRRLRADHPEVEVVSTSNAEENTVMRHLNESIGFRPTATVTGAVIELPQS
jgi:GNAT superfamily N-acetyltransferase/predicted GNAT family acetyltransferase